MPKQDVLLTTFPVSGENWTQMGSEEVFTSHRLKFLEKLLAGNFSRPLENARLYARRYRWRQVRLRLRTLIRGTRKPRL